jgi:hypothetical protein
MKKKRNISQPVLYHHTLKNKDFFLLTLMYLHIRIGPIKYSLTFFFHYLKMLRFQVFSNSLSFKTQR